jgi:hypothetical protein
MNPKECERLVDATLDRALGPQLVEPRTGMEERILANLPKEVERRPWWQWMWIPALAVAAVLAVVIGMRITSQETPAPQIVKKAVERPKQDRVAEGDLTPQNPVQTRTVSKRPARHVSPKTLVVAAAAPLPRQNVFPTSVPLTDQERLLLAFVNHQRPQAEMVAVEQQSEREKAQKYFESGEAPVAAPTQAQPMR